MRARWFPTKLATHLEPRFRKTLHINGRRIFPAIDRFDRNQDAHLRRDLDHADFHTWMRRAKSDAVAPFHCRRILPPGPSTSIRQSDTPTGWGH